MSLFGLLLCLLLLFFQFFDFLFQFFDLFAVIIELLDVSAVQSIGRTERKALRIKFPGIFHLRFSLLEFLQRGIQLLSGNFLFSGGQIFACRLMKSNTEISESTGLQFRLIRGGLNDFFVEALSVVFVGELSLPGIIVKQHRIFGQFNRFGLFRQGIFGRKRSSKTAQKPYTRRFPDRRGAFGQNHVGKKEQRSGNEKPMKFLHGESAFPYTVFGSTKLRNSPLDGGDAGICNAAANIDSARFLSQFFQSRFVKFTGDEFPGTVPAERSILIGKRSGSIRVAQTDDKERDIGFFQIFDRPFAVARKFFAVGKKHHGTVAAGSGFKGFGRLEQSPFQVGSAERHAVRIQFIDILVESHRIGSQRAEQKGVPRKGNDTETVALRISDQFPQQELGMFQTARRKIIGKHTSGNVKKHHDIASALLIRQQPRPVPRSCGGGQQTQHGDQKQNDTHDPPVTGKVDGIRVIGPASQQILKLFPTAYSRMDTQRRNSDNQRQSQIEQLRVQKIHN